MTYQSSRSPAPSEQVVDSWTGCGDRQTNGPATPYEVWETTMGPNGEGRRRPPVGSAAATQPQDAPPAVNEPVTGPVIRVSPATDADAAVAAGLHVGQISE